MDNFADSRSPETNYATRDNIVHPGSAAQKTAAASSAAQRMADKVTPNIPTNVSPSGSTNTVTVVVK